MHATQRARVVRCFRCHQSDIIRHNVSRNRTDGNISRRRRKKYSSSFVGWYALIQKCLGWQCVTLTSLENFTHKTFYSDLVGKSADDEGSGFSLFFPRLSAHVFIRKCSPCTRQIYPRLHKACYWMSFSMTLITFSKIPRARDINLSPSRALSVD